MVKWITSQTIININTYISTSTNQKKVEPESFRLVDLCLNQLALFYLNVSQATQILYIYIYIYMGLWV